MQFFVCSLLYFLGFLVFSWYVYFLEVSDVIFCGFKAYVKPVNHAYDYIIVGSGSAGSIVALRLGEIESNSVLVLEAGPKGGTFLDIPALAPLIQTTNIDWQYSTVPQSQACGALNNNVSFWPSGRLIGGTNQLNNLIYSRGHRNDYNLWYKDLPNFNYEEDILPYFKKTQNYKGSHIFNDKHHSKHGQITVKNLGFASNFQERVLKAFASLGFKICDINSNCEGGFTPLEVSNVKNAKRYTNGRLLLDKKKHNVHVVSNAQVEKVLFKSNYEAYAVKYTHLGKTHIVKAKKGIILSAGVIGSPKILLLSGVGPRKHLNEVEIPTKIDLPVGENLQDHITTGYDLISLKKPLNYNFISMCSLYSIYDYFINGQGPWTMVGAEVIGLVNLFNKINGDRPDLEFMALPLGLCFEGGQQILKSSNVKKHIFDAYFKPMFKKTSVTVLPVLLHPKSVGTVKLLNKDPKSMPVINPNYLSDSRDVEVLLIGIKLLKKLVRTPAMVEMGAEIYNKSFPGCESFFFDTDDYWRCYIRQLTLTTFHPVGTCKMGSNLQNSVVNFDFKVHGTHKLYVVDGSVIPLPSGNPNAIITMIAEKASDVIKNDEFINSGLCCVREVFLGNYMCKKF